MTNNKKNKQDAQSSGLSEHIFKGCLDNVTKGQRKYGVDAFEGSHNSDKNAVKFPVSDGMLDSGTYAKEFITEGTMDDMRLADAGIEQREYAAGDVDAVRGMYIVQKIADMLSKLEKGEDFEVKVSELYYLSEAIKKTGKRAMAIGGYLDEEDENGVTLVKDELIDALRVPISFAVASIHDRAVISKQEGVLYIWVRD